MGNNNQQQALWQCKKCGTTVYNDKNRQPNTMGCPAGSFHSWVKLTR
jgi:ribosomal protein L37E